MRRIERVLALLPPRLQAAVTEQAASRRDLLASLSELRLRAGRLASITVSGENIPLPVTLTQDEIASLLSAFCGGSLYAHRETIAEGFLDLGEGVRCGISGTAVTEGGAIVGVREPTGLVVRFPHDVRTAGEEAERIFRASGRRGLLIFSPPGVGKTTLLCDLGRRLSSGEGGMRVALVDCRGELSGGSYGRTALVDILVGYPKHRGIEIATRVLSPEVLLVDEIGSRREAESILAVVGCGVPLVATAHAESPQDLCRRAAILPLLRAGVFENLLGLARKGGTVCATPYAPSEFLTKR